MGSEGTKVLEQPVAAVTLAPHQERVVAEKADLDDKIEKLETFQQSPTHESLVEEEKNRLATQLHHMKEYAAVLGQRIAAFI